MPHRMHQLSSQVVDIGCWERDADNPVYPVGRKPKQFVVCPKENQLPFLIGGHRYLYKQALDRRTPQLWSEVLAFGIAEIVGLSVPPAYVAIDSEGNTVGVLIEFFYGYPSDATPPRFVHGIDLMAGHRVNERIGGLRANIAVCKNLKVPYAHHWWAKTICFDALIGNTDRHLENWGVLVRQAGAVISHSMPPVYDNGTSLGWELPEERLHDAAEPEQIQRYIAGGRHHFGWKLGDRASSKHVDLCGTLCAVYPSAKKVMLDLLKYDECSIEQLAQRVCEFDVGVSFTPKRAHFVTTLLRERRRAIKKALGEGM